MTRHLRQRRSTRRGVIFLKRSYCVACTRYCFGLKRKGNRGKVYLCRRRVQEWGPGVVKGQFACMM